MNDCSGTIVIAFERIYVERGIEKRDSDVEKVISDVKLPTVWNQIEPSMAYVLGQPLLVIVENGLRSDGLLETGYDWYVQWVDVDAATLQTREFLGVFSDWKKRVEEYQISGKKNLSAQASIDLKELTISQILGSLKPAQLWAITASIVTAIVAIAGAAYKLGTIAPKTEKKGSLPASVHQAHGNLGNSYGIARLVQTDSQD
jgi:hypothetical protein